MAYSTINKSTAHFNTKLYTGNGSTNNITGVGFQPDWLWIKSRGATENHVLYDAVRGVTKQLYSNTSGAESTNATALTGFASDGFNLATSNTNTNANGSTFVSWNWKAASTSIPSGSTTDPSAVRINTTSGFGIYKITAPGSGNYVLKHGLGASPSTVFVKRTDGSQKWMVWHHKYGNLTDHYLSLNSDGGVNNYSTCWGTMNATDCTIATGGTLDVNAEHVIYVFTEKYGFSQFGTYKGNGQGDGTYVGTSFKPTWIMIKEDGTGGWRIFDNKRPGFNEPYSVKADDTSTEETGTNRNKLDLYSNGFKLRMQYDDTNGSSGEYIYMAFGQTIVGSNNIPATAR